MLMALNMAWKILFIVFFFGFCIFIHEFGHLLAALWMGLHVEKFSIGFGKRLWSFKYKGVDFAISLLPFGGYVALPQLDPVESPESEDGKQLAPSTPLQRAITAFAGPAFNVLFGFVLATIMCVVGIFEAPPATSCLITDIPPVLPLYENGLSVTDEITAFDGVKTDKFLEEICRSLSLEEAGKKHTISVIRGSETEIIEFIPVANPEWEAGLRSGDRIIAINGKPFKKGTEEFLNEYVLSDKPQVTLTVIRDNVKKDISFVPHKNPLYEGLAYPFFAIRNPISAADIRPGSAAEKAGLKAGDQLLQLNGANITNATQMAKNFAASTGKNVTLKVARSNQEIEIPCTTEKDATIAEFGISFSVIISSCIPDFPAYKAGLRMQDRILSVNGINVTDAMELTRLLRESKGAPLSLKILRDGKELDFDGVKAEQHEIGGKNSWIIGVTLSDGVTRVLGHPSPWAQFNKILSQTGRTLKLLFSPITSKVSGKARSTASVKVEHMSGPLGIVMMLWYSLKNDGLRGGISFIILITFSLAFMNLLPIPVLDGGHVLFSIIELIIRRRLPPKFLSILQNIFAVLLIGLILYITFFDGRRAFRLAKAGSAKHHTEKVEAKQIEQPKELPAEK